ncbi:hypothetical protein C453_06768 [Haloferax elongans ATCC BAA-1513]|uniref:DUF8050 domain-containing protein n=1 Tax=Haloferax elongans ATCC BAA-1513 TaxID=1230453 RepID=M0HTT7_HALEO|nr:TIGR04206 family protein [Haloferax elongans]ELZ86519.1 hypothetical protein C453_06768 [Haloferax elongans ATCC BAA-1513]
MTTQTADGSSSAPDDSRFGRFLLVFFAGVAPWSIQTYVSGSVTFLFAWGLFTPSPVSLTTITDFFFRFTRGLPEYILVWPLGVACYLVALAGVTSGLLFDREDVRLTVAGLVCAGLTQLEVARGFSVQPGRTAWPLGTVLLWAVAGYLYWSRKR